MKLLLIEDNQSNAEIFIRMLSLHGYSDIVHKATGIEGLFAAKDEHFDLILIDFDLPDIHGAQVGLALATMMQQKRLNTVPLVALTAQSDKGSQAKAQHVGFDAFVGKPCLEDDLANVVSWLIYKA